MRPWVAVVLAVLLLAAGSAWGVQKGEQAPTFSLSSTDGEVVSLADLSGSVVVVSFWATWGKQCQEELKQLQTLAQGSAGKGLVVLGINEREERATAEGFAQRNELEYRVLLDDGSVARAYGVNGLPDLWVIGRNGVVRSRLTGYGPGSPKEIETAVAAALAGTPLPEERTAAAAGETGPPLPLPLRAYAHLQLGAAHVNIGDAFIKAGYRDAGHFKEAVRELRSGVALDPKNVELHVWLGVALERDQDKAGSIREYQAALTLDPANVYAQDALRRLGVPPAAAEEQ